MPGGDGTGPLGRGSRTGRALGFCSGYDRPGYANPAYGRGFGRGYGRGFGRVYGRGFGRGFGRGRAFGYQGYPEAYYEPYYNQNTAPQPNAEEEKSYLENLVKGLEQEIKSIKQRLSELSKENNESQK